MSVPNSPTTRSQPKGKGPGLRLESKIENPFRNKWRVIRWSFLIVINFLFFASFYFDIQVLEGTLSASRLLGFHLADPFAALQLMLASQLIHINLVIGVVTIIVFYWLFGGRTFCSWVCPYHLLAELADMLRGSLVRKGLVRFNRSFDRRIRYYLYAVFLLVSFVTGYMVFEIINPVAILSRAFVYGIGLAVVLVVLLLLFEVFYSKRAWCRYFCPVGVSYTLLGHISPMKVKWNINNCSNCKSCQSVCMVPWVLHETVNQGKTEFIQSGDCTRCGLCIDSCSDNALTFKVKYLEDLI